MASIIPLQFAGDWNEVIADTMIVLIAPVDISAQMEKYTTLIPWNELRNE